jgi:putative inorganic carbon (hco3(-)) transporter
MPLNPEAFDYEGVFPARRGRGRESDAQNEVRPSSRKVKLPNNQTIPAAAPAKRQTPIKPSFVTRSGDWIRRRGHSLSFIGLFLFSIVLYYRPYESVPGLSSFTSMAFYTGVVTLTIYAISQLAIEGNLTARPKEINLVLLIGVAALLSMPMAVSLADAWKTFSEQLIKTMVIFVVLVNVVRTETRLKLLLLLILVISLYLSLGAINDYRLGLYGTGALITHDARIAGRIKGLFENSNDLALHLVTMVPIAIGLGLSGRNPFKKLLYFGGAALMVGAVIVTFSRGGFIGLVAMGLILVRRLGKKNRVATTGAMVFAVILFLAFAPGAYSGRLSSIFNSSADLTGSSSQRTEVLKRSFWVMLRYPIFGVGIGNFHHKSPRNLETHNAYTQVGAEMGIAAMAVYILFLVHPLRRLRLIENESYSKPEQSRFYYLSIGLQGSLVAFMVSSFFGAVAYQWYVYYLVAYAVCLHRLYIMKFQTENEFAGKFWEQPFAKKTKELVSGKPAPQLGHV